MENELDIKRILQICYEQKINLNQLFVLILLMQEDMECITEYKMNKPSNYQGLKRARLIDENLIVTKKGAEILSVDYTPNDTPSLDDLFEEFWNTYPTTDKFQGYPKTRILRFDKQRCKRYWLESIQEIEPALLLSKLKSYLKMIEVASITKRRNEFTYVPALPTWLNTKVYDSVEEETETSKDVGYGEELT